MLRCYIHRESKIMDNSDVLFLSLVTCKVYMIVLENLTVVPVSLSTVSHPLPTDIQWYIEVLGLVSAKFTFHPILH